MNPGDTEVHLESTAEFEDPESGTATAFIGSDSFTYASIDSGSTLGGCSDIDNAAAIGTRVSQTLETDTTLFDDDGLRQTLRDRVYKENRISDEYLYTQTQLDDLAKDYLEEFYKNHNKINVDIMYAPYLKVGQTVSLTDSYNNISSENYFIESISDRSGHYQLVLAKYPS